MGLAHGIGCQTLVIDNNRLLAVISLLQSIYLEYYRKQTLVYYVCFLFWYLPCVYFALLAHSTKTKLVESENFSSGALHFDPKHRTFNIVSIVCIVSNFLSFVWFAASIVWNDGKKKFKAFRRFQRFQAFLSLYFAWENISHVLSKNCHVLGNQTLFSEAERGNCFVQALFTALQFSKLEF